MQFNTIIYTYELDHIEGKNDLCNCDEDLKVLKNIKSERNIKMDEFEAKFTPNYFTRETIGCYCPKCKKAYLIHRSYEASSKIDFETIQSISEMNFTDLMSYFRLREKLTKDNDYIKGIDIDYYSMNILRENIIDNVYSRSIAFSNDEEISNYMED